jgi:ubiquinol-cytochrome c reductase iron-sulfur subunit
LCGYLICTPCTRARGLLFRIDVMKDDGRRNFIYLATASFAAAGVAAAMWPAIRQMSPPRYAVPEDTEVDLSGVADGFAISVKWDGMPVHIRHRTASEIEQARQVAVDSLIDRDARLIGSPQALDARDENRVKQGHENWLAVVAVCTRESCVLPGLRPSEERGNFGGWFCPCCAAHYDTSGRTRTGIAPRNLAIPPYSFIGPAKIALMPRPAGWKAYAS